MCNATVTREGGTCSPEHYAQFLRWLQANNGHLIRGMPSPLGLPEQDWIARYMERVNQVVDATDWREIEEHFRTPIQQSERPLDQ